MTVSGLVMPPVQNSVQSLSMSLFCWSSVLMMLGSQVAVARRAASARRRSMMASSSSTSAGVGEDAVDALGVEGGERRLVEPLDLDAAVLGDVVLQHLQEAELLRREARVLVDEVGERLLDRPASRPTRPRNTVSSERRVSGSCPARCFTLALSSTCEHEPRELFELVVAHGLAGADALQDRVLREVLSQHRLDAPLVLDEVEPFELAGCTSRPMNSASSTSKTCGATRVVGGVLLVLHDAAQLAAQLFERGATVDARPEVLAPDLLDGVGLGLHRVLVLREQLDRVLDARLAGPEPAARSARP